MRSNLKKPTKFKHVIPKKKRTIIGREYFACNFVVNIDLLISPKSAKSNRRPWNLASSSTKRLRIQP